MELIRGIARNVRRSAQADALDLDLDGQTVRLDQVADDSLVQDGDDLIVAGQKEPGAVVAYAYRNISQGYGVRASCRSDAFQGTVMLVLFIMAAWATFSAQSEIQLFLWLQYIMFFALALLFGTFAVVCVVIIVEKFLAGFRVNRAAIETVKGAAGNVRLSADNTAAYFDISGHQIELVMPRKIAIANGDEVIVAGQRTGGVLAGMDYRNVTKGVDGRSWTVLRSISTLLMIGALLVLVITGLWFEVDDAAIFIAIRRALALAFLMGILILALDRFFQWLLDVEAWRRISAGQ